MVPVPPVNNQQNIPVPSSADPASSPPVRDPNAPYMPIPVPRAKRPAKRTSAQDMLMDAIKKCRNDRNETVLELFVRKAYEDNTVLVALVKKLLPDLKQTEMFLTAAGVVGVREMSDEDLLAELRRMDELIASGQGSDFGGSDESIESVLTPVPASMLAPVTGRVASDEEDADE